MISYSLCLAVAHAVHRVDTVRMQEFLTRIFLEHPVIAPILFIAVRSFSTIIPPIPGIMVDLVGIYFFGWFPGFLYGLAGTMLGSMVSFTIARVFREPLTRRIIPLQKFEKWEERFSEKQKFWALVAIRIPTSPVFDYLCYIAGLTKISPAMFFLSTLAGSIPIMFFVYFFGHTAFERGFYWAGLFVVAAFIISLILRKIFYSKPQDD